MGSKEHSNSLTFAGSRLQTPDEWRKIQICAANFTAHSCSVVTDRPLGVKSNSAHVVALTLHTQGLGVAFSQQLGILICWDLLNWKRLCISRTAQHYIQLNRASYALRDQHLTSSHRKGDIGPHRLLMHTNEIKETVLPTTVESSLVWTPINSLWSPCLGLQIIFDPGKKDIFPRTSQVQDLPKFQCFVLQLISDCGVIGCSKFEF